MGQWRGCAHEGCQRQHSARGLCSTHYYALKRTGQPLPPTIRVQGLCGTCGGAHYARGLCKTCYDKRRGKERGKVWGNGREVGVVQLPPGMQATLAPLNTKATEAFMAGRMEEWGILNQTMRALLDSARAQGYLFNSAGIQTPQEAAAVAPPSLDDLPHIPPHEQAEGDKAGDVGENGDGDGHGSVSPLIDDTIRALDVFVKRRPGRRAAGHTGFDRVSGGVMVEWDEEGAG